jgi:ectoine hydroxylase-related dioxygenase (phytanoyl-CoA dioxygenase family)
MPRTCHISPELIQSYQALGAVVIRGVLNSNELKFLETGIEHNLANLSTLAQVASHPEDPGRFVEDFCTWQTNPDYEFILRESSLPHVAAQLMQSQSVRLYHDHLLVKEPGTQQATPWHQDQPYYNVSGRQNVSFWIPVDPVSIESTLRFVAKSHSGVWYMPRTFKDQQAKWFPEGSLADLPPVDDLPEQYPQLAWPLEPGDCVAFQMLTLHASGGVGLNAKRRVFSARYLGDDARHAVRSWRTSPPFENLKNRLPDGAEMNDSLFPIVWN